MTFNIHSRCMARKVGDHAIVEHLDSPLTRHVLSPTARHIWDLVEHGETPDAIVTALCDAYGVPPDVIRRDVAGFLKFALDRGFLEADATGSAWLDGVAERSPGQPIATVAGMYADLVAKAEEARVLHKASLELTYRCNIRCVQCYAEGGREQALDRTEGLPASRWLELIGELRALGCLQITFTGGEPFAHPAILDLLRRTDEAGCAIRIQTNGLLLRARVIDALGTLTHLETLEVSVFGATSETYDAVTRSPGGFKRLSGVLQRLSATTLPVYAKYVTMRQNFHDLDRFVDLTDSLGLRRIVGHGQIYPSTLGSLSNTDKTLDPPQMLQIFRKRLVAPPRPADTSCWLCRAGLVRINVTPHGEVWPCERLPYSLGNVREAALESVWRSSRAEDFRAAIAEPHPTCEACDKRPFCCHCWAMPWLYDRVEVGEAITRLRGYSPQSCRIAEVYRTAAAEYEPQEIEPRLRSQVF